MIKKITIISFLLYFFLWNIATYAQNRRINEAVRTEISKILTDYERIASSINESSGTQEIRHFIELFKNQRAIVFMDYNSDTEGDSLIRVDAYIEGVGRMFPKGLSVELNHNNLDFGYPKAQTNNIYLIRVNVKKKLFGISQLVYENLVPLVFTFEYEIDNGLPENIRILSILKSKTRDIRFGFHISPAYTNIINLNVFGEDRYNSKSRINYNSGIEFDYFFKPRLGIGCGLEISTYQNVLQLDHFDPVGGFDPNFIDVEIINTLQYIEIPVFLKYKTSGPDKLSLYLSAGMRFSYLFGKSFTNSGVNKNNYKKYDNVISDIKWKENMVEYNYSGFISAGLFFPMGNNLILSVGGYFVQGLKPLEQYKIDNYSTTKYSGAYNPLYGEPNSGTVSRATGIEFGINFIL